MPLRLNEEAAYLAEKNTKYRARHTRFWRVYDQYYLLGHAVDDSCDLQAADSGHGFSPAEDSLDQGDGRKLGGL